MFTDFVELHGDRGFGDDKALITGLAKFRGRPVAIVGHQKGRDTKQRIDRNFRPAEARRLPQGSSRDGTRREIWPPRSHLY